MAVGGLLGLASIAKVSGLAFFPLVGLALLFIHRGFRRALFRDGILILAVCLVIGGWWYVRNALLYGDPLSVSMHMSGYTTSDSFVNRLGHILFSIERTFWGNLSRTFVSQIKLGKVLIWWGRISLILFPLGVWFNRRFVRANLSLLVVLLSWPVTFLVLLVGYWNRSFSWAYGRLLFPVIAPTALLFVLGWQLASPPRWRRLALALAAGLVVVVSVLVPFVSIYPLYHPWREWTGEQVEHPADLTYVDPETGTQVAQLVGYNLPEPFALPGTHFPVELCWKPLAQTHTRYAAFVHLLDLSQLDVHNSPGVWGSRRTYPGLGNLPTDRWAIGKPFCDLLLVQISPDAPTPLGAAIEVGFIDPESDERLQAVDAQGNPVALAIVGGVPVLPSEGLPVVEQPPRYILDDAIGLDRVEAERGENTITLTLTWQSLQSVSYDATIFLHLRGADGELLAQVDHQPLDGRFPTSYWLSGQVVTDTIHLPLTSAYDGPLTLNVGMYTWPSLERLAGDRCVWRSPTRQCDSA